MRLPLNWKLSPDPYGAALGTGFDRLATPTIHGLIRLSPGKLEILAVAATEPGQGQFRAFIRETKVYFSEICVWEVWNPWLGSALKRYGFVPACHVEQSGDKITGWRWLKEPLQAQTATWLGPDGLNV